MEHRKKRVTFSNIRDRWLEGLIILACITIPFLDFFGLLDEIPFLSGKISNFTLLLLAVLTGYVAFTQPEKQEVFHETISEGINKFFENISNSSTVVLRAHPFPNIAAGMEYTRRQIEQAKQQVLVVYPELQTEFYKVVPATTFYKQIFTIEPEKLSNYQKVLPRSLPRMPRNYSYACLRLPKELLQCFVIIDDKELIILSDLMPISTRNSQFVKIYRQSFNEVWDKAIKLKTNDRIHEDRIEFILTPETKVPEVPAELAECVKNCLKAHEKMKSVAQQKRA